MIKKIIVQPVLLLLACGIMAQIMVSCEKKDQSPAPKFLDVNVRFNGVQKPQEGDELKVALFYKEVTGFAENALEPDNLISVLLTRQQIDGGIRVTFEDFKEAEQAFVVAYVDIDRDGASGPGDLIVFHNDKSFEAVAAGEAVPDNVAGDYAITINLNKVIAAGGNEGPLTDTDGNEYQTVTIGEQTWMAENLKVTTYNNGDPIATGLDAAAWTSTNAGAYAIYPFAGVEGVNSEAEMVARFGLLYNWHAINDARGTCPEGWRVATDQDWKQLESFLGMAVSDLDLTIWRGTQGPSLKSPAYWVPHANAGTDDFGFSALPGGSRYSNGNFDRIGTFAYFWTATEANATNAYRRLLRNDYITINRSGISKNEGSCIRCLKNQ